MYRTVLAVALALAIVGPAYAADRTATDQRALQNTLEVLRDLQRKQKLPPPPTIAPQQKPARVRDPDYGFPHWDSDDDNDFLICEGAGRSAESAALNRDDGHSIEEEVNALHLGFTGGFGKRDREEEITRYVWTRPDMTPGQLYSHYKTACVDRINARLASEPPPKIVRFRH